MSTAIESFADAEKTIFQTRETIFIDNGADLFVRRGRKRERAYITSINFTPVVAIALPDRIQVFPLSQLSEEDQTKIDRIGLRRRIQESSYTYTE